MNDNFLFKDRLAWTILHTVGEKLIDDHLSMIYDLEKEYELIQNKTSKLSANNRKDLAAAYEALIKFKNENGNISNE